MSHKVFDGDTAQALADEYEAGASLRDLARRHGTNTTTIRNTLRRLGVGTRLDRKPKFWTPERNTWLVEQYESGRSQQDIADEVGVSQVVISGRLRSLGVLARKTLRREQHGSWKGGRRLSDEGYVLIIPEPDDAPLITARSNGYVLEHRLVMARHLGRPLRSDETVHHIDDSDKTNNAIENLQLRVGRHGKGAAWECADCGSRNLRAVALG